MTAIIYSSLQNVKSSSDLTINETLNETGSLLKDSVAHLHKCPRLLAELVIVFELDSDGLVTVQAC